MIVQMSLVDTTGLLANRSQSTRLTMFHSILSDPINPGIATNSIYTELAKPCSTFGCIL